MTITSLFKTSAQNIWQYYLWPFGSTKRIAGALIIQQSLHFGIGSFIYPHMDDALENSGVTPEIASSVSMNWPHIITPLPQDRSFFDHAFSLTESTHITWYISISIR